MFNLTNNQRKCICHHLVLYVREQHKLAQRIMCIGVKTMGHNDSLIVHSDNKGQCLTVYICFVCLSISLQVQHSFHIIFKLYIHSNTRNPLLFVIVESTLNIIVKIVNCNSIVVKFVQCLLRTKLQIQQRKGCYDLIIFRVIPLCIVLL